MQVEIEYFIGKEVAPLDTPPFRAYFYRIDENILSSFVDYSIDELAALAIEIETDENERSKYTNAINDLRNANKKTGLI